jgi:hypothetical protein
LQDDTRGCRVTHVVAGLRMWLHDDARGCVIPGLTRNLYDSCTFGSWDYAQDDRLGV